MSTDATDQWDQLMRFDINNQHPAVHTLLMWVATRLWTNPGAVSLLQVGLTAVVLAVVARRLVELGAKPIAGVAVALLIATWPAVGLTTVALFKDVPFTIAMLWALTELLGYAADPTRMRRIGPALRLGLALALVWLLRHNGFITVVILLGAAGWRLRRDRGPLLALAGSLVGSIAVVNLIVFPLARVDTAAIQPATVFISDVAASFVHEPANFTAAESAYMSSIAEPEVWNRLYDCHDSTPLVFSAELDKGVILSDPEPFRDLVFATYLRDPDTVLGHRWCAASYLMVSWSVGSSYFHRPPFDIPPNTYGIVRRPISDRINTATLSVWEWIDKPQLMWITWRPAVPLWAATAALVVARRRGRSSGLLLPAVLLGAHTLNVAVTTPAHEYRFAYPVVLMSFVMIAVVALRASPGRAGEVSLSPEPGSSPS